MQKTKRAKRPSAQQKYVLKKRKTVKWIKNTANRKARRVFKNDFDIDKNVIFNKIRDIKLILS